MTSPKSKTVLVGGCFDIIHWGHVVFLNKAKSLGGRLIVLLESDEKTKKLKGKTRPVHSQNQRKKMLLSLRSVDEVICVPSSAKNKDYLRLVRKVNPKIIATTEGDPHMHHKDFCAKDTGAEIKILTKVKVRSTSQIYKLLKLE